MAHSTPEQSRRCLFLGLPAEIRLIIYEHVYQLQYFGLATLRVEHPFVHLYEDSPKALALTQVNRQIRQETLSIIYRNVQISIELGSHEDRRCVDRWTERLDSAILEAVSEYAFYLLKGCQSVIMLHLGDLKNPVQTLLSPAWRFSNHPEALPVIGEKVKEEVQKLEILGTKGRVMTMEAMQTLSKLLYEATKRSRNVKQEL